MVLKKRLLAINPVELIYLDETGTEKKINFLDCHKNYVKIKSHPDNIMQIKVLNKLSDEEIVEVIETIKNSKRVAIRENQTFIFYTEPLTHFEFDNRYEYLNVLFKLAEFGWIAFDGS